MASLFDIPHAAVGQRSPAKSVHRFLQARDVNGFGIFGEARDALAAVQNAAEVADIVARASAAGWDSPSP
jgi:hypothetical protein